MSGKVKIEIVHLPRNAPVIARALPTPAWDTEWIDAYMTNVEFFATPVGHPFRSVHPDVARLLKGPADTNSRFSPLLFPRGNSFILSRVVLYPEYPAWKREEAIEHAREFREHGTLEFSISNHIHCEVPLRDAMPLCDDPRKMGDGEFDPSESPDLLYRRGARLYVESDDRDWPLTILENERPIVTVRSSRAYRITAVPFKIRAYLVGTWLVPLCG